MTRPASEKVAFWELSLEDRSSPHSVQPSIHTSGNVDIGIFDEQRDIRTPVQEADLQPSGKYRCVLKLFFRSAAAETWTTATGWLLKDDLAVTAAHCVLEGDGQRATCVRACIGYGAGSSNAGEPSSNERFATRIALPFEWSSARSEQFDVAFLQLDSPFRNVAPLAYRTPETKAQQQLTVVGYPADLGSAVGPGGEMYAMEICREINLEQTKGNMLTYQGDSGGGLSGAPVIRNSDGVAVGMHVRGGSFNLAVVIGGPYGVDFHVYEEVVKLLEGGGGTDSGVKVETDADSDWLKYVYLH
jgi:V8-like Glu-specific endopeptidase